LTRGLLLEGAREVIAIERDERCRGALEDLAAAFPGRLRIVMGDATRMDICALARAAAPPVKLVANLPYNVATLLLIGWLSDIRAFASLTVMVQKEVAARLAARPRTKDYGRLSVLCQWLCDVRPLFDVPPRAFTPPPKVTSTVVQLVPRGLPLAPARRDALESVTQAAFGQRRKMLRSSLKALGADPVLLAGEAGIDPTRRAEELSVEEFCALARAFAARAGADVH
jgi:16S rRNA (adenine1518-N6/adenine1519-N6)-dimethyltransferase